MGKAKNTKNAKLNLPDAKTVDRHPGKKPIMVDNGFGKRRMVFLSDAEKVAWTTK